MISIWYDGECPLCKRYVKMIRLKQTVGKVRLINLREHADDVDYLRTQGFHPDEGMVVQVDGNQFYHGDDAVHVLASLSAPSGVCNRLNYMIFSRAYVASLLYPLLKTGRNTLLFLLGKPRIQPEPNDMPGNMVVFSALYGFFAIYHFIIYFTSYGYFTDIYVTAYAYLVFGFLLTLNPRSLRWFILLTVALLADGYLHAPVFSNHTIIINVIVIGIVLIGVERLLIRKRVSYAALYGDIALLGKCCLIIMYFFGVFHKINSGFLNPDTSCAVILMEKMPFGAALAQLPFMQYAGIYGTYIIEALIIICLLVPRWRYAGIVAGVAFHIMLATSTFAFYATFSILSIMLHALFLPENVLTAFKDNHHGKRFLAWMTHKRGFYILIYGFYAQLILFYIVDAYYILWLIPMGAFLYFVITCARETSEAAGRNPAYARSPLPHILAVLFFINGAAPYIGIKDAQSINMFSNLILEKGRNNHLILKESPYLYDYVNDSVEIIDFAPDSSYLKRFKQSEKHITYYTLLHVMERERLTSVTYKRGDAVYSHQSYETLKADIESTLHHPLVRKWIHFRDIDPPGTSTCF